jgi:hypothetical protein
MHALRRYRAAYRKYRDAKQDGFDVDNGDYLALLKQTRHGTPTTCQLKIISMFVTNQRDTYANHAHLLDLSNCGHSLPASSLHMHCTH